jgi:hypothetical protein
MIEPLEGLPDGVIGFEAVGEVHAADYADVLIPAVDAAAAAGGVRLVYVLGERFTGYSVGAGFEDLRLGVAHLQAWQRGAIVTDHHAFADLVKAFAWLIPGRLKLFPLAERDAAIAWVAAPS